MGGRGAALEKGPWWEVTGTQTVAVAMKMRVREMNWLLPWSGLKKGHCYNWRLMRNTINICDYGKGEVIRPQITSLGKRKFRKEWVGQIRKLWSFSNRRVRILYVSLSLSPIRLPLLPSLSSIP